MNHKTYLLFKKVYTELKILIEKSKKWEKANFSEIEKSALKLEEAWERVQEKFNKDF